MSDGIHLSFHQKGPKEILIVFDRAGGEALIARIRETMADGDHLHDHVPKQETTGWLTRLRPWHTKPDSKFLAVQYQFEEDADDWVD
jgi:hypothetical protein